MNKIQRVNSSKTNRKNICNLKNHLIFILVILSTATIISAQDRQPERGFQFANSYTSGSLDSVNVNNGNLVINLPIASLPKGRGTSPGFTVTLQYNSKLWDSKQTNHSNRLQGGTGDLPPEGEFYSYFENNLVQSDRGGWKMLSSYRIIETNRLNLEAPNPCQNGDPVDKLSARWKMEIEFPDGSVRQFTPVLYTKSLDGYYDVDSNGRSYAASIQTNPANSACYVRETEGSQSSSGMTYITTDGSRMRLFVPYQPNLLLVQRNWKIYSPDGTIIENAPSDDPTVAQRITERNGGFINIKGGQIVDQLGRSIEIDYDHVTVKGVGGELLTTQIVNSATFVHRKYQSITNDQTGVPQGTDFFTVIDASFWSIQQVILPQQSGGQSYTFEYNGASTQPSDTNYTIGWGELKSVTFPTGAKTNYTYDTLDGTERLAAEVVSNRVLQKDLQFTEVYDGISTPQTETTYYNSDPSGGSMLGPDGRGSAEQFYNDSGLAAWSNGLAYRSSVPGVTTERIWKQNLPYYTGNPYPYPQNQYLVPNANAYVKTEFSTIYTDTGQPALTAIKDFNYDKNGNVTRIVEYDWVPYSSVARQNNNPTGIIPPNAVIKRITINEYYNQTPDANSTADSPYTFEKPNAPKLKNVIKSTEVQNAAGVPVLRSEFYYDNPNTTGNLIETRTWDSTKQATLQSADTNGYKLVNSNFVKTTATYDQYGNPLTATDANGVISTLTYEAINGFTGLYPTKTEAASNYSSLKRTSTAAYDFYTGLVTSATDVDNNLTSATIYDAIGRPTKIKTAVGTSLESWTQTEYDDVLRRVIIRSDLESLGDAKKVAVQHFDQLGRVRLTRTLENPLTDDPTNEQQGIKVQTRYRAMNPFSYVISSNPYRAATSTAATNEPTMGWTRSKSHYSGKQSEAETFSGAILPEPWGNNQNTTGKVQTDIDANSKTVTDQAGRKRKGFSDSLGRMIQVIEDPAGQNLSTDYVFDTIGNLIKTIQGEQSRYFMYDSLGRLLYARQPEQDVNASFAATDPTTNNSGWSVRYQYDDNGNIISTTDARGVSITGTYDALNRLTYRDYSDTTADVTFTYDDMAIPFSKGHLTKISSSVSETRYNQFDHLGRLTGTSADHGRTNLQYELSIQSVIARFGNLPVGQNRFL